MLVLALLLILLAAGVTTAVVLRAPTTRVELELGGFSVAMEPLWVFLTGAATALLLVLGLELLRAGFRRANNRRRDRKELNRLAAQTRASERGTPADAAGPTGPADARALETRATQEPATTDEVTGPDRPPR